MDDERTKGADPERPAPFTHPWLWTVRLCRERRYGLPGTLLTKPSFFPIPTLSSRPGGAL